MELVLNRTIQGIGPFRRNHIMDAISVEMDKKHDIFRDISRLSCGLFSCLGTMHPSSLVTPWSRGARPPTVSISTFESSQWLTLDNWHTLDDKMSTTSTTTNLDWAITKFSLTWAAKWTASQCTNMSARSQQQQNAVSARIAPPTGISHRVRPASICPSREISIPKSGIGIPGDESSATIKRAFSIAFPPSIELSWLHTVQYSTCVHVFSI